jgi:hypothetical protein
MREALGMHKHTHNPEQERRIEKKANPLARHWVQEKTNADRCHVIHNRSQNRHGSKPEYCVCDP